MLRFSAELMYRYFGLFYPAPVILNQSVMAGIFEELQQRGSYINSTATQKLPPTLKVAIVTTVPALNGM